jgi:hypothetical protein
LALRRVNQDLAGDERHRGLLEQRDLGR